MPDLENPDILVIDRQHPDFESCAWTIRRSLIGPAEKHFGRWVTSPERGRFTVLALQEGFEVEQMISFADSEDELIELCRQRRAELPAKCANIGGAVAPEVFAKLQRLGDELNAMQAPPSANP